MSIMPVRNVIKYRSKNTHYHVYNRGHNRSKLYLDNDDYEYFTFLLKRTFGAEPTKNMEGYKYPWYGNKVRLLSYCLMPNHFHLLIYQFSDIDGLSRAMQSLSTTYGLYFKKKYKISGSIYESTFKASAVFSDIYLMHITRYIHMNHKDYTNWAHSSYSDYTKGEPRRWVDTKPILELFDSIQQYKKFHSDYLATRTSLNKIKHVLADEGIY